LGYCWGMKKAKRQLVKLSKQDEQQLNHLLNGGRQPVRVVLRGLALRRLGQGEVIRKVADLTGLTPKTVWLLSRRYRQGGLDAALYERPRPGQKPLLNAKQRQSIIALVCSQPPAGRTRWTVELLAEEAVKRKLVARVGRETIRVLLQSHEIKPWREKNVVCSRTE
jgi:putative transposase